MDRRRGHAAGDQPRHAVRGHRRRARAARGQRALRRPRERRRDAQPRPAAGRGRLQRGRGDAGRRDAALPSTHNLGTCRMSRRPGDGVVDRFGRAHDVPNLFVSDGSVFTTGAAANPTLTIVALAIRQAEYIATEYRTGSS
ncbi:GMC oxidoreductase [Pseudonocardia benzenivorans]